MINIRKSEERGQADHGWLQARHSFSFASYQDPDHMQYSVLRVLNEDVIAAGAGFAEHPHRNMEIVTYILSGELRHRDSMGNGSVIRAGEVQRMTAGSGVRHSEFNASTRDPVHLMQIWMLPAEEGLPPSYEDQHFSTEQKHNQWCLIASPHDDEALLLHQDVRLYATVLDAGVHLDTTLERTRCHYVQVAAGHVLLNGLTLQAGDAAKMMNEDRLIVSAKTDAELLWFDLPVIASASH